MKTITRAGTQKKSSLLHLMKCDGCDEELGNSEVLQEGRRCWKCKQAIVSGAR